MSELFDKAFVALIKVEGGFVNDKADRGGATKFGVSLRTYKKYNPKATEATIKNLTLEQAKAFYQELFWLKSYEQIKDENIASKVFDAAVNMGHQQAHICLQRSLNCLGFDLVEDGVLGLKSLEALNHSRPPYWDFMLNRVFASELAGYYRLLIAKNTSYEKFKKCWLRRGYNHG